MVEYGEKVEVADLVPFDGSNHVIGAISAASNDDVCVVIGVPGFDGKNRENDLRGVELGEALGAAELVELAFGDSAPTTQRFSSAARRAVR
jgi:hypothetical protein